MRENQHPGLADGFVIGEGGVVFLLKRLEDAERDGDRIYAVVRGLAGASDGKGKGITAPNPVGQRLAVERAWRQAGLSPATVGLIEGHGTSTRVGDVVEVESLMAAFAGAGLAPGSVPLGSVKSNIGHLKSAAGGAGMLKAVLALRDKVLPPSLHFDRPNPAIDFEHAPFHVNTELLRADAEAGRAPARAVPPAVALHQPERIAIDYGDAAELASKARAGSSRPPPAVTPRPGSCCAPWACSVARAPPPRWPSSTPARAPSTSTCWPSCARPSRWWARPSTRRTASWPRCSAGR